MRIVFRRLSIVNSTNMYCADHAQAFDQKELTVVYADEQTAGKGRDGRSWTTPPNGNLCASFCFFLSNRERHLGSLGQLLAVSAWEVVNERLPEIGIKWPNDLLLGNKKLGGVLCEIKQMDPHFCVIAGIGINVNAAAEELAPIGRPATSLSIETGQTYDPTELLKQIAHRFQQNLTLFLKNGISSFQSKLQESMRPLEGMHIRFHEGEKIWEGIFSGLYPDGSLKLLLASGIVRRFYSGEITIQDER